MIRSAAVLRRSLARLCSTPSASTTTTASAATGTTASSSSDKTYSAEEITALKRQACAFFASSLFFFGCTAGGLYWVAYDLLFLPEPARVAWQNLAQKENLDELVGGRVIKLSRFFWSGTVEQREARVHIPVFAFTGDTWAEYLNPVNIWKYQGSIDALMYKAKPGDDAEWSFDRLTLSLPKSGAVPLTDDIKATGSFNAYH